MKRLFRKIIDFFTGRDIDARYEAWKADMDRAITQYQELEKMKRYWPWTDVRRPLEPDDEAA